MSVPLTAIPRPQWREKLTYLTWQIRRSPLTMAGLLITLMVVMCMIFAPWLASHDPNTLNLAERLAPPSAEHWFGTDEVGRDLFSRVLYGSQQSVGVGLFVAFASCFIGGLLGCFSGVIGGRFDALTMRLMDIMLSVPSLVLIMALAAALVATGRNYILDNWWYSTFPGLAILITATGFNLLGDGVRDLLDPRQQGK